MTRARPLLLIVTGIAAGLGLASCRRTESEPSSRVPQPGIAVVTTPVTAARLPVLIEAPATVRPAERASIAAKLTGTVATFPHGLGTAVAAGEVLLTLEAPEIAARARQAQAQLAEAERHADRQRTLVASGVNPPDALRDAEDRLRYAQAAVAEADALFAFATVRAPFAGVITEKHVLPGDLAIAGAALLTLESTHRLRAEGAVPEKAAAGLRPGSEILVSLDDDSRAVTARIEEISAAADVLSRSVLVKAALPEGIARSGQFARLQIPAGEEDALLVPVTSVSRLGQMERVFVASDGHARLRLVKTGRVRGEQIEILAGLAAGETVVVSPPAALRDGQPILSRP